MTRIESTYGSRAIVVEESVLGGATPAYLGIDEGARGTYGRRTGLHLTGEQVRDMIEALKPYAAEEPLAEWERELLAMQEEPIEEVDGFHLGDEVEGYVDGRGVIVGFEDEAMKRGASGDVVVDWSEGTAIAGRTLGATLSCLTKVKPKPVQEIPTGTTVKVLDKGDGPGQVRHFGGVGGFAKVVGWTDTSAEPWDYDETYEIEFERPGEPLFQSVSPSSIRPVTLAEALDRTTKAIAAAFPARYMTGVDEDPAVKAWGEAISDRPFVSFEEDEDEDEDVEPEPESFGVGDRVRVKDASGSGRAKVGMIGTVAEVFPGGANDPLLGVETDDGVKIYSFGRRFEPAPEPKPGFSVGDRVKVTASPYLSDFLQPGATGKVEAVLGTGSVYTVRIDGADTPFGALGWNFQAHYLTAEPKVEIRLGDKVRVVRSPYVGEGLQPGDTGRVVKINPEVTRGDYTVKMDGGSEFVRTLDGWGFQEGEIEHVSGTYSPVSCDLCAGPCEVPNSYR